MKHLLGVSLTLVGFLTSHGLARVISKDQECVSAVFGIVGGLNFEGIGYGNYYLGICQNPLKVVSTYAISKTYCSSADLGPGFEYLNWACLQYAGAGIIPEADVAVNLTDESISRFPILDQKDVVATKNLTTPVLVTRDWFDLGFRTEVCSFSFQLCPHPKLFSLTALTKSYRTHGIMSYVCTLRMGKIQLPPSCAICRIDKNKD